LWSASTRPAAAASSDRSPSTAPATISFHGTAVVHRAGSLGAQSLLDELGSLIPAERRASACVIEITPVGAFRTFGLGVSLRAMLNPAAAQARVPVAPQEGIG
jgi:hypothetical protein